MRATTAKALRNRRSNSRVSLTFAAVAAQATGTPSPVVATWYLVPRLPRSGRVRAGQLAAALGAHRAAVEDQVRVAPQHRDQQGVHPLQEVDRRPVRAPAAQ